MALISGTTTRYDITAGQREALHDAIYNISPEDTPFMSGAGRGPRGSQTTEFWLQDSLAAADGNNAHLEGDEASFTTATDRVRVGNVMQISKKTLILSGTVQVTRQAGVRNELAYELAKKSAEMKLDQETIFLRAQAGDTGGVGTPRRLAALLAWVKTNVDMGVGGGNPTYTSGIPNAVRTDGTQRPLTETIFKNVIQLGWTNGAKFRTVMVGAHVKTVISGFTGIAQKNFDLSNVSPRPTAVIAAADVYVSDFGTLRVIPNRFQRGRDCWFIDWDMVEVMYLRPHQTEALAKTGDADKRQIVAEYTLKVKTEVGLGLAADLATS